jgi:hypothetical protein
VTLAAGILDDSVVAKSRPRTGEERKERPFVLRFLLHGSHAWDPYPGHLRDQDLMECARCGLRARPVQGLRS